MAQEDSALNFLFCDVSYENKAGYQVRPVQVFCSMPPKCRGSIEGYLLAFLYRASF